MNTTHTLKRIIAGVVLWGGVAMAGFGLGAGTAQAKPGLAPQTQWCPGQYRSKFIQNMQWDWNVCHDWHLVPNSQPDQYGVKHFHAEEGPEPPPPPGLNFCPVPPWCP